MILSIFDERIYKWNEYKYYMFIHVILNLDLMIIDHYLAVIILSNANF